MKRRNFFIIGGVLILFIILYIFRIDYFLFYKTNTDAVKETINSEDCIQLYPSNGSIKIVFIPEYSYTSGNNFKNFVEDIEILLDEEGNNSGFFSIDIIAENKDKFNFYYYNKIPKGMKCKNGNSHEGIYKLLPKFIFYKNQADCSNTILEIMDVCKVNYSAILYQVPVGGYAGTFENEAINGIANIDTNFREKNIVPNYYSVSRSLFSAPLKFYETEEQAKIMNSITFTHEMSHIIFRLADLYKGNNFIEDLDSFQEKNTLVGCSSIGCSEWCEDYDKEKANELIENLSGPEDITNINIGINCSNDSGCYLGCYGGFSNLWRPYADADVGKNICDIMFDSQNCFFKMIDSKSIIKVGYNDLQKQDVEKFFGNLS